MKLKNLLSALLCCAFLYNCGTAFDLASGGITEHQKEKPESKDDKRSIRAGVLVADLMFLYLAPVTLGVDFLTGGIYKTKEEVENKPDNESLYLNIGAEYISNSSFDNNLLSPDYDYNYQLNNSSDGISGGGFTLGFNYRFKKFLFNLNYQFSIYEQYEPKDIYYIYDDNILFSIDPKGNVNRSFTVNGGRIFELNKFMNLNLTGGINYGSMNYWYYHDKDLSLPKTTENGILYPYERTRKTIQNFALEFKPSIDFNLDKYFGGRLFMRGVLGKHYNYLGFGFEMLVGHIKTYDTQK